MAGFTTSATIKIEALDRASATIDKVNRSLDRLKKQTGGVAGGSGRSGRGRAEAGYALAVNFERTSKAVDTLPRKLGEVNREYAKLAAFSYAVSRQNLGYNLAVNAERAVNPLKRVSAAVLDVNRSYDRLNRSQSAIIAAAARAGATERFARSPLAANLGLLAVGRATGDRSAAILGNVARARARSFSSTADALTAAAAARTFGPAIAAGGIGLGGGAMALGGAAGIAGLYGGYRYLRALGRGRTAERESEGTRIGLENQFGAYAPRAQAMATSLATQFGFDFKEAAALVIALDKARIARSDQRAIGELAQRTSMAMGGTPTEAVQQVTAFGQAWNLSTQQMRDGLGVINALSKTVPRTGQELLSSMNSNADAARRAGFNMQGFASIVAGGMANSQTSTSDANKALENTLYALDPNAPQFKDARAGLRMLNLSPQQFARSMREDATAAMISFFRLLSTHAKGNDAAKSLFGENDASGVMALARNWERMAEARRTALAPGSAGSMTADTDRQINSLETAQKRLAEGWAGISRGVGEAFRAGFEAQSRGIIDTAKAMDEAATQAAHLERVLGKESNLGWLEKAAKLAGEISGKLSAAAHIAAQMAGLAPRGGGTFSDYGGARVLTLPSIRPEYNRTGTLGGLSYLLSPDAVTPLAAVERAREEERRQRLLPRVGRRSPAPFRASVFGDYPGWDADEAAKARHLMRAPGSVDGIGGFVPFTNTPVPSGDPRRVAPVPAPMPGLRTMDSPSYFNPRTFNPGAAPLTMPGQAGGAPVSIAPVSVNTNGQIGVSVNVNTADLRALADRMEQLKSALEAASRNAQTAIGQAAQRALSGGGAATSGGTTDAPRGPGN